MGTVPNSGVTPGFYAFASITVNSDGRVTKVADGTDSPVFTSNLTISGANPKITLTDTTGSAKSLAIDVDSNRADLRESAGASGSLLLLDLANNRASIGTASPRERLHVSGGNILLDNSQFLKAARTSGGDQEIFALDSNNDLIVNRGSLVGGQNSNIIVGVGSNQLFDVRNSSNSTAFKVDTTAPTSGQTVAFLLYHNGTTTTVQRVTVGATDSGGTGFKVLRVPN